MVILAEKGGVLHVFKHFKNVMVLGISELGVLKLCSEPVEIWEEPPVAVEVVLVEARAWLGETGQGREVDFKVNLFSQEK